MSSETNLSLRDRVLGGLWGALVGDALGVPVEFLSRSEVQSNPVRNMREQGTHGQPKGTWSDDGSLTLCTAESLLQSKFDPEDMGRRFLSWYNKGIWAAHGTVFDIGRTTAQALNRISEGMRAEVAGGDTESSNGNGSLMRILPVSLRFFQSPPKILLDPLTISAPAAGPPLLHW